MKSLTFLENLPCLQLEVFVVMLELQENKVQGNSKSLFYSKKNKQKKTSVKS